MGHSNLIEMELKMKGKQLMPSQMPMDKRLISLLLWMISLLWMMFLKVLYRKNEHHKDDEQVKSCQSREDR